MSGKGGTVGENEIQEIVEIKEKIHDTESPVNFENQIEIE